MILVITYIANSVFEAVEICSVNINRRTIQLLNVPPNIHIPSTGKVFLGTLILPCATFEFTSHACALKG